MAYPITLGNLNNTRAHGCRKVNYNTINLQLIYKALQFRDKENPSASILSLDAGG